MTVARLGDLVDVEIERIDAPAPKSRDASPPMARLREAGRELAVPVGCLVDGQAGTVLTTLDRVAVVEFSDGDRQAVPADRVQVGAGDVRCRPAQVVPSGYETMTDRAAHARRGREGEPGA